MQAENADLQKQLKNVKDRLEQAQKSYKDLRRKDDDFTDMEESTANSRDNE